MTYLGCVSGFEVPHELPLSSDAVEQLQGGPTALLVIGHVCHLLGRCSQLVGVLAHQGTLFRTGKCIPETEKRIEICFEESLFEGILFRF